MRYLAGTAFLLLAAGAQAPTATCRAQATEKKVAGTAKSSHVKKCVTDAVGS